MRIALNMLALLMLCRSISAQFYFPDYAAADVFHDGDSVDVAYFSSYASPVLSLYCSSYVESLDRVSSFSVTS